MCAMPPELSIGIENVALRTALQILFDRWALSASDAALLLGGVPEATVDQWRQASEQASVDRDLLERLSYLVAINHALAGSGCPARPSPAGSGPLHGRASPVGTDE